MADILWNNDDVSIDTLGVTVPKWLEYGLTPADIAAINQGGCESGAFMPAVTYAIANDVMHKHGDDILEYIENDLGELPAATNLSWKGLAVHYFSLAVELFCYNVEDEIIEALKAEEDEECEGIN